MRETTTASGLVVHADAPKPVDVARSFGGLKGEFFDRIPHAGDDLAPSEIQARVDECKVLVQQMRSRAFRDRDTAKLHDVHVLTHELQLAIGALREMHRTGKRVFLPGDA